MDLPSKTMYDAYKDEIWKDLGPLDPDWFEALTAQVFTDEGNVSDQEDLCANQEESFKTPLDKTAVDSQLFSTPKVFRHSRVVSPEPEDDQTFTGEQEKETLPWTATQSPYLFPISKEGVQGAKYGGFQHEGSFELLHTPHKSPINCRKHISESLGAQLHPDMSWTSSLNTPPAVPSTLILSKTDESPCPMSVSAEKNIVFVRTLFPSLSNASRVGAVSPKNNGITTVQQAGGVSPKAGQSPESPDHNDAVWKQTLPDAIEDGEIRKTVASVLDGAENVLSIFFTNSSSALRKVKTDRVRRKQMIPTEERGNSSSSNNAAPSEQRTADPDIGITQWSPLSLSEIPLSTVDTSCHDKSRATQVEMSSSAEEQQSGSGQLIKPHMKLTDSGFPKKKRTFVYTVETPKSQTQGNHSSPAIPHSGQEVNVEQLQKAPDEAHSNEKNKTQKQGNPPPSTQAKVQDFDMSQLCKDFAQDFSQMSDACKLSAAAMDAPRNGFSPSVCLSAMRRAKQKAMQANLHHDREGVSKQRRVSTTNQNDSTNETNDSGFQSAVSASSFILPSSEISVQQWSGFKTDSHRTPLTCTNKEKTHLDGVLQEAGRAAKPSRAIKESQTGSPGRESTSAQPSSAKETVDNINHLPLNGQTQGSLPENTVYLPSVHASGFKTASNKGIHISSANLERGKRLFEEMEVEQTSKCAHDTKDGMSVSDKSMKTPTNVNQTLSVSDSSVDMSYQLTASQKADVTELCTLLEEADSQFEFTQFETTKPKQHCQYNGTSPQKVDKELDPDFLSGIDFDDSFSSEAEKHLAVTVKYDKMTKTNCEKSSVTSKSTGLSAAAAKKENSSLEDVSSSSKHISEGSSNIMSDDRAGCSGTSKHPVTSAVGFKTAGGNVLRVSKKCLSKARALFADLEENLVTSQKSEGKQSGEADAKTQSINTNNHPGNVLHHKEDDSKVTGGGNIQGSNVKEPVYSDKMVTGVKDEDATKSKMDTTSCPNGFQMASGKGICISAKALQKAAAFFKDCDATDSDNGTSVGHQKSMETLSGSVSHKETLPKCKSVQTMKVEPIKEFENESTGAAELHTEAVQHNVEAHSHRFKSTLALTNTESLHGKVSAKALSSPSCTTSKNSGSSDSNELSNSGGFHTASGKTVSVSAGALKKAECLLNEIHTQQEGDAVRMGHLTTQIHVSAPKNGGFQTASGKGVAVSSAALKKAKLLLSECDEAEDKSFVKPTLSKKPLPGPAARSRGLLSASGKQVAFSAEALHKAKAPFSDTSLSADIPAVSHTRITDKKQEDQIHCGFTTAGGAKVHVSQKSLLKAKHLLQEFDDGSVSAKAMQETDAFFKDCDIMDGNEDLAEKMENNMTSVSGSEKKNISKFKHDPRVTGNIYEESGSGSNCNDLGKHGGFSTASGKTVSVSDNAMIKAKSLLNENASFENTNKELKQKDETFPSHSGGFQTASGKGVVISPAALKKAQSLFSESDEAEDKSCVKPTLSKKPLPGPAARSRGLLSASGKQVAFSAEALHKAKALVTDKKQDHAENPEKIHCGFSTAGGAKVHVSQKNLLKAKHLLEEIDDGSVSANAMQETDAFFKDCDVMDGNEDLAEKMENNMTSVSGSEKKNISKFKHDPRVTGNIYEESGSGSNCNDLGKHGGFSTASGKTVSVSDNAMTKAKSLLNENASFENPKKELKQKDETFPAHIGGFQTASGKGVVISPAALKKAKSLFSESDEAEDKSCVKPTLSKKPLPAPTARSRGLLSASGKEVAFSAEAIHKAKAPFSDLSLSADIPAVSHTRITDKKQEDQKHCGFTTAGGAKVHVSQKSLLKAKHLLEEIDDCSISAKAMQETDAFFKDCEVLDGNEGVSEKHENSGTPVSGKNLSKFKHDPRVTGNICEESGRRGTEFKSVGSVVNQEENMFHSANAASSHGDSSVTTKPLSPLSSTTSNNCNDLEKHGGFSTASGKTVSVSDNAMTKAKSLLNENASFENTNKELKQKEETFPSHNGGFQTASGKGVVISPAALKKAQSLFSENDEADDKTCLKATLSKKPLPAPAASGKQVAFSAEALHKAKGLFSDISLGADIPAPSHTRINDKQDQIHCGFSTAGGAKVHVSQKSLLKAKHLLEEFDDGSKGMTTDSDKDMPKKFITPQAATSLTSLQETNHQNQTSHNQKSTAGCPGEEMSSVLVSEINQKSNSEGSKIKRPEESPLLNFQCLNLIGCTETQQKFLAQEALDCTKALLEDESVAGLSMTENESLQESLKSSFRSEEERKDRGKRPAEDLNMTGQPPLKRRLLEEFDRTVDSPRGSTLQPEKSCPNGVMKDRRVFKYSVSLHPNITTPHRNGKGMQKTPTQYSTSVESRVSRSTTAGFVPPFFKNTKTESGKDTLLKDSTRTPSAFVPPFKKQRTVVHQSSSKPQKEEDKCHNSSTYVPPTKKTQIATDVTGSKSKEDIQTVASAETTNDNLMNNHCGSEDTLSRSQDMFQDLHNIELARDMQDMRIRKKKRQTIRPLPGSLFLTKTSGVSRIPLKAAVNGKPPARYTQKQLYRHGVHQHVCEITSENAESFRFSLQQFIKQEAFIDGGGVQLADGGWLIPSRDGTAGKEEFHRALCDTPGVDPKLISEAWVYNHYRWIVWKQASMERSFPETVGGLCLTPEQILLQLKYRYDVEVDHSRRPALRKIMEKDDTAAKTLVLCVCGVVSRGHSPNRQSLSDTKTPQSADAKVENPSAVVWLTDGLYAIKAQLDDPLTAMLHKGRVAVGVKLIIHGAQLVGSPEACSPLEAPESLMLKICANSSRPTRWDVKLGFHKDPRPFLLPVSSLYSSGGPVGCVDIIILRSYPIQWMERKPDGGVVFRSVRAEEKEARRYNSHKQKAMEILFAKIQAEFEQEDKRNNKPQGRRRTISRQSIAALQDGEELYEAVGDDPAYLEAHLSEQQLETLGAYRRSLMEKKQAELQDRFRRALENAEDSEGSCPKRDVTPVWRLCIADSTDQPGSVYQLNLWRPSSDLQSLIKEGCRYKVYNLTTSDVKKHGGSTTVQLTGTKKTQFQDLQAPQEWISTRFQTRVSTHFEELQNPEFQSLCGEVDLSGYVISVVDGQGFSPAFYLTDGKLNFVKVRCFSSFAQSGLEDLVKPRVLLALSNLQLRGQSMSPTPVVYAGDLSVFSTNPKEVHLQEALSQLRNLVQGQEIFFPTAEETLSHLVKSDGLRSISSPALPTRSSAFTPVRREDTKTSVTSQQPIRSLGSFTPVGRKPPAANCHSEKDLSSLKRRRALDYLSRIPSPPSLSNLSSVASPCVNMTFNPPRRRGAPSTLKTVQTPAPKPVISPVEDEWVNDEELAMIDTQALHVGDLL